MEGAEETARGLAELEGFFLQEDSHCAKERLGQIEERLCLFRENPVLLDPIFSAAVATSIKRFLREHETGEEGVHGRVLYLLGSIRGRSEVVKHLPLSLGDFKTAAAYLARLDSLSWEERYVVWLWCSHLIALPFPALRILSVAGKTPEEVFCLATAHARRPGKDSEEAALFIGNLLLKRDVGGLLEAFIGEFRGTPLFETVVCVVLEREAGDKKQAMDRIVEIVSQTQTQNTPTHLKILSLIIQKGYGTSSSRNRFFQELFASVHSKETALRWCAAEQTALVLQKLGAPYTDKAVARIVHSFSQPVKRESVGIWEGSCLLLANIVRNRGELFCGLIECIQKALLFRVRSGATYFGACVRDSACYAVWSLARSAPVPGAVAQSLAQILVPMSVFDESVSCRRSGSAALQELIGRTRSVEHGDVLAREINFYAVGNVETIRSKTVPLLCGLVEYRAAAVDHLVGQNLFSALKSVREEASQCLALFSKASPGEIERHFGRVLEESVSTDPFAVHGALLAASAVCEAAPGLFNAVLQRVSFKTVVGAELVLEGVLGLMERVFGSKGEVAVEERTLGVFIDAVFLVLCSKSFPMKRKMAEDVLPCFVEALLSKEETEKKVEEIASSVFLKSEKGKKTDERVGCCLSLGCFARYIGDRGEQTAEMLRRLSKKGFEERRGLSVSIGRVLGSLISFGAVNAARETFKVLSGLLCDYTSSHTGDAGAFVRREAVHSFMAVLGFLGPEECFFKEEVEECVQNIVLMYFGRQDRLHETARECLRLFGETVDRGQFFDEKAFGAFGETEEGSSFGVCLMDTGLAHSAVLGVVYSAGSIEKRKADEALAILDGMSQTESFPSVFLSVFGERIGEKRFVYSLLKTFQFCLERGRYSGGLVECFCQRVGSVGKSYSIKTLKLKIEAICSALSRTEGRSTELRKELENMLGYNCPVLSKTIDEVMAREGVCF
ncbi:MAG: tubulin-specific chaperone D [Amphiamblys sp. WSBS2006]|nr:MAG: tubulin-specific chaperone D [Amphiamblys sp. WSBS2006]